MRAREVGPSSNTEAVKAGLKKFHLGAQLRVQVPEAVHESGVKVESLLERLTSVIQDAVDGADNGAP